MPILRIEKLQIDDAVNTGSILQAQSLALQIKIGDKTQQIGKVQKEADLYFKGSRILEPKRIS
jgi:hypothetical protein